MIEIQIPEKINDETSLTVDIWERISEARLQLNDTQFVHMLSVLVGEMINCVNGIEDKVRKDDKIDV